LKDERINKYLHKLASQVTKKMTEFKDLSEEPEEFELLKYLSKLTGKKVNQIKEMEKKKDERSMLEILLKKCRLTERESF
jgi:DNA-binding protein Fis